MTTNNVPATADTKNALQKLAARLDLSPAVLQDTLKKTVFSSCSTNEQFVSAVIVANTYGLNPILKEMYAFPSKGGAVIPIVAVDGWVKLVNRQENFDGMELQENFGDGPNKSGTKLDSVTAKFYLKNRAHPVVVTEWMEECYDGNKEPWRRWPRRMLRHKAYIQGARLAFGFSGIYDEDEKDRIIEAGGSGEIQETPIVTLKNGTTKKEPVENGAETALPSPKAEKAVPEVDLDAERQPGEDDAQGGTIPEGFEPSSSQISTPIEDLKVEIDIMSGALCNYIASEKEAYLKSVSYFKGKSGGENFITSADDPKLTHKWAVLVHRKIKEAFVERFQGAEVGA